MIDQHDAKNLLALLERVNLAAREVDVFVHLRNKLQLVAAGPTPLTGSALPTEPAGQTPAGPEPRPQGASPQVGVSEGAADATALEADAAPAAVEA